MKKINIALTIILLCYLLTSCNLTKTTEEAIETNTTTAEATQLQDESNFTQKKENAFLVNSYSLSDVGITLTIPKDNIPKSPYIIESYQKRNIDFSNLNFETVSNTDPIDGGKVGFISIIESPTETQIWVHFYPYNQSMQSNVVYDFVAFKKSDFAFNENQVKEKTQLESKLYKVDYQYWNPNAELYLTYEELISYFKVYEDNEILICDIAPLTSYYKYDITKEDGTSYMPNSYQKKSREDFLKSTFGEEIKNPDISWTDNFFDYMDNHFKEAIGKE